jgi:hypothetical protein
MAYSRDSGKGESLQTCYITIVTPKASALHTLDFALRVDVVTFFPAARNHSHLPS